MKTKFNDLSKLLERLEDRGFEDCVISLAQDNGNWVCYWDGNEICDKDICKVLDGLKDRMLDSLYETTDPSELELFAELCNRRNGK